MTGEVEATTSTESYARKSFEILKSEELSRYKECHAVTWCRGWSTSGVIYHLQLKTKHSIKKTENFKRPSDKSHDKGASEAKRNSVQQKFTDFF